MRCARTGKERFKTITSAVLAICAYEKQYRKRYYWYPCWGCRGYHLTTQEQRKKRKAA